MTAQLAKLWTRPYKNVPVESAVATRPCCR